MERLTPHQLTIHGTASMKSPLFSSEWRLVDSQGTLLADLRRYPRLHVSTVRFRDGTPMLLEPHGWGVVRALDMERREIARVTRQSMVGRKRWQLASPSWSFDLVSDPIPRRWHLAVGGSPVARMSGSLVSYNTVTVDTMLSVPVTAVILAWHVVARPWEAAAAPRTLVPITARPAEGAA